MVQLYIKGFLLFAILFAVFHTLRFIYSTSFYFSEQGSIEAFRTGAWACEMDKRLVTHLRTELREREKLLKYREKVINALRKTISRLNTTGVPAAQDIKTSKISNNNTVRIKRDVVVSPKTVVVASPKNASESLVKDGGWIGEPTPFPVDLEKVAESGKRPCCMGLKRMADILNKHMETTKQLKEQIALYEKMNITAQLIKYGEVVKKRTIAKNCSTHFIPKSVTKEKDGLYLSTDMRSIYEAIPLFLEPKQKLGNFGAKHRNMELIKTFAWALNELHRKAKQSQDSSSSPDVIFKTDPIKGNQYRFIVKTKTGKVYSIPVLRPLGPLILDGRITDQSGRLNELINIIVPISERQDRLEDFLLMLQEKCSGQKGSVFLTFVVYGNASSTRQMKTVISRFSKDTGFSNIDVLQRHLPFSRGGALHDGVQRWNGNKNVLLFFCDVDVSFDPDFLRRCRMNTEPGAQVYYPVLFSQYNPDISKLPASDMRIHSESGTWRPLGFGMACMYRQDYLNVGGFNLKIKGWGGEDNDLYGRLVKSPIKIIRAPDSGLYHRWHTKHCDKSLDNIKYKHCLGAKARYEGSQRQLGLLLFKENTTAI